MFLLILTSSTVQPVANRKNLINEMDLERFKSYASRIRVYHAQDIENQVIYAFIRTWNLLGHGVLLPCLQGMHIIFKFPCKDLSSLFHPDLIELSLDRRVGMYLAKETIPILQSLSAKCPSIRRLHLMTEPPTPGALDCIRQMCSIVHLTIAGPDIWAFNPVQLESNFLASLSSADVLSSVELGSKTCVVFLPPIPGLPLIGCPNLVKLRLCILVDSLLTMEDHLLGLNSLPTLQTLELGLSTRDTLLPVANQRLRTFCASFSRIAPNMKQLQVFMPNFTGLPVDLNFQCFTHALTARLTSLSIQPHIFLPLERTGLDSLSRSAPFLETFHYDTSYCVDAEISEYESLGPSFLADIALTLTNLSSLRVAIDMIQDFPPLEDLPPSSNKVTNLQILSEYSPKDPAYAAKWLCKLFPNLIRFAGSDWSGNDLGSWNLMTDIIAGE